MDNRQQINAFIDAMITDPLNKQNTAARVRAVLKYIVQNAANLAEDDLGIDPNPAPQGVSWTSPPTVTVSGTTVSVSQATASFAGTPVSYDGITFEAVLAGDGLQRIDAVYGRPDGTYGYKLGDEGETGVTPTIPTGTLIAGYTFFNSTGGGVTDPNPGGGLTEEQVQTLLGDYLPLQNPTRTQVTFGPDFANMDGGLIDFDERGLEINHYKGNGETNVYWMPDGAGWYTGSSHPIGPGSMLKLWVNNLGGRAGIAPYSLEDGTAGVRLYTRDVNDAEQVLDFKNGQLYLNGQPFAGGAGASTFDALTDTPSSKQAGKWLRVNAGGTALEYTDAPASDLSGYQQKSVDRTVNSTGTVTLTLDRDAHVIVSGGQLTGNLTINLAGGVKGVVQILNFKGNGSATVTVNGATNEGSKSFVATLGATNKLFVRAGQNELGTLTYYFLWA